MKKEIHVYIENEEDLLLKYDHSKLSRDLLDFLIAKARIVPKKDSLRLIVHYSCDSKVDLQKLFYEGFQDECENIDQKYSKTNILQFGLLVLGFVFLFLSFQMRDGVLQEIFLIGGWVPIWEMVDLELFSDMRERRRKKTLLRLMNSEIVINREI